MKAKAGILMIAIGMMAFTGFGATTADPIQNSETDIGILQDSASVNVVMVAPALEAEFTYQFNSVQHPDAILTDVNIVDEVNVTNTIAAESAHTSNVLETLKLGRNPRDGLSC